MSIRAISMWRAPVLLLALVSDSLAATEPADQVFFNGKVFTADAASVEQAFAIRGDRFTAEGLRACA